MSKSNRQIVTKRQMLLAAMALPLAGCDLAPYGASLNDWGSAFGMMTGLESGPDITRQQASDVPFATIGFRVGRSPEGILILASTSSAGSLWTSSSRRAILTTKGRIRQTAGFPWNLGSTLFTQDDPVGTAKLVSPTADTFQRLCDFSDIKKFQVPITANFEVQREDTITILGTELKTICVAENCRCEELDWNFSNYYWIDGTNGFVWRSSQNIHPNEDPFVVEVLRPEA